MIHSSDISDTQIAGPRVYLVTGATGAIGKAIARQLAATANSEVVLLCRNRHYAEQAIRPEIPPFVLNLQT
jgi:NAD(P)-dependent dehydrogenase (short-subunit alcohol dehydrogenase family)